MRSLLILFLVTLLTSNHSFSQNPSQTKIIPPTPNAASIAQYGNIPVGLYTGQPSISFPIHVIDNGHVKVPINLSYNYNGLKLEEYPTWVGTGWTLNATSVITRQVRSLPDESPGGFNGEGQKGSLVQSYIDEGVTPSTPNVDFAANYPEFYSLLNGIVNNQYDAEPDMFVFSCPGYSGKFYFDESQCNVQPEENGIVIKTAKVLPAQNITIKGHFNYDYQLSNVHGEILKFEIIDERGNIYTFAKKERNAAARLEQIDSGNPDLEFENTWYLSTITDPFSQTIQYTYITRKIHLPPTVSQRMVLPDDVTSTPKYDQHTSWEVILDHIISRNHTNDILERIDFIEESTERQDWHSESWERYNLADHVQPKALEKIKITSHGKIIKEFKFTYGYFGSNARLRLDKFQETNNGEEIPAYEFSYIDSHLFPKIGDKNSLLSQDHWGYYRGTNDNSLLMPIKIVDAQGGVIADISGNDRAPVPESASIGILTDIKYPTGGTTHFEYEPNDYNPAISLSVPSAACGNNMVLKKRASAQWIESQLGPNYPPQPPGDELNFETMFELVGPAQQTICVRVEYSIDIGDCADDQATVAIYDPSMTQIWSHGLLRIGSQSTPNHATGVEYLDLVPGQYKLQALVSSMPVCGNANKLKNKAIVRVYSPDESNPNRIASGMRVKSVMDCPTEGSDGCISKFFSYEDLQIPGHSSGSLVNGPIYMYPTKVVRQFGWTVDGFVASSQSQVPILSTMGNNVGYRYVTVTEAEDGSKGKSVHKFTSPTGNPNFGSGVFPFNDPQVYPFPPPIDNDWQRGIDMLAQEFKASSANPMTETSVTPNFQTVSTTKGLKTAPRFNQTEGDATDLALAFEGLKAYHFIPYNIQVGWQKIVNQSNSTFDEARGAYMTTTMAMEYANSTHRQITRKETVTSTGKTKASTYKYKADVASISGLTTAEVAGIQSSPFTSTVFEEKSFEGTKLLNTNRMLYQGPNLAKVQQSIGSSPLSDEVVFNSYDARGNVKSYTTRSGEVHTFIYGYKQTLPIAEAINVQPEDIFYDGFEELALSEDETAKTGERVLKSSTYTFPSTFNPTSVSNTRMSYWYWSANTWHFSGELPFNSNFTAAGSKIDDVRAYPVGTVMSTYTYTPGKGMTSVTDANGISKHFEHDDLGRLKLVRDENGNIIKRYKYHYASEAESAQ